MHGWEKKMLLKHYLARDLSSGRSLLMAPKTVPASSWSVGLEVDLQLMGSIIEESTGIAS